MIKILDPDVAAKVSASEVIERPESVVKELLENSLDAGAKKIQIRLLSGGFQEIVVEDDGTGIRADELELAVQRFATSKIVSFNDLEKIATYGFRGEALHAICQLSELTIQSKTADQQLGYAIFWRYGSKEKEYFLPCLAGTRVSVKNLFASTPARRKFQTSENTEKKRIMTLLQGLMIANRDVAFKICLDSCIETYPSDTNRIAEFFGENLAYFESSSAFIRINGYIGLKSLGAKGDFFIIVNSRVVQDRIILSAVKDGMSTLLKKDSDLSGYVSITIDPSLLDVNCHPRKLQVKFVNPSLVYRQVLNSITSASKRLILNPLTTFRRSIENSEAYFENNTQDRSTDLESGLSTRQLNFKNLQFPDESERNVKKKFHFLCSLGDGFLVFRDESSKTLVIVDPHAAHERILFNQIQEELSNNKSVQALLSPVEFQKQLSSDQVKFFQDNRFSIEVKETSFKITAIPAPIFLSFKDYFGDFILSILDFLNEGSWQFDNLLSHLCARLACHRSFRLRDTASATEAESFLNDLMSLQTAYCPHGRRFIFSISEEDLHEFFGR